MVLSGRRRGSDGEVPKPLVVERGIGPALPVPLLESGQLDSQNRCLHLVQPAIYAHLLMVIADRGAMIPQNTHSLRHSRVVAYDSSGLTVGAEILGVVEAEAARIAYRACGLAIPPGAVSLTGVLDHLETIP